MTPESVFSGMRPASGKEAVGGALRAGARATAGPIAVTAGEGDGYDALETIFLIGADSRRRCEIFRRHKESSTVCQTPVFSFFLRNRVPYIKQSSYVRTSQTKPQIDKAYRISKLSLFCLTFRRN